MACLLCYIPVRCYWVTLSSHFTMPNITHIDTRHTARNTPQHCQMGQALSMMGPTKMNRFPMAVAPSHRPWHKPTMCRYEQILRLGMN